MKVQVATARTSGCPCIHAQLLATSTPPAVPRANAALAPPQRAEATLISSRISTARTRAGPGAPPNSGLADASELFTAEPFPVRFPSLRLREAAS